MATRRCKAQCACLWFSMAEDGILVMARLCVSLDDQDSTSNVISEQVYASVFKRDRNCNCTVRRNPVPSMNLVGEALSNPLRFQAEQVFSALHLRGLSAPAPRPWGSQLLAFGSYAAQVTSLNPCQSSALDPNSQALHILLKPLTSLVLWPWNWTSVRCQLSSFSC